jgi:hypothetical protein
MSPDILDGDFILTFKWFRQIRAGQLVAVDHETYGFIVKRVVKVAQDGQLWLEGTNRNSLTPERIGWVSPRRVLGKVWLCSGSRACKTE